MVKEPPPVTHGSDLDWSLRAGNTPRANDTPPPDYPLANACPICGRRHEPGPEGRGGARADWILFILVVLVVTGLAVWLAWDLSWSALDVLRRGLGSATS